MAVAGICWNSSHPAGRAMHPIQPALSALYSLSLSISSSSTCMEDGLGWGGGQTWTHATSQPPPPTRGPHISHLASRSSIASKSFALFKAGKPQLCVARHPTWSNSVVHGPLRRSLFDDCWKRSSFCVSVRTLIKATGSNFSCFPWRAPTVDRGTGAINFLAWFKHQIDT